MRAVVKTDLREWATESGQQIAKLMATLTQVRQDNGPSCVPGSSQEREHRDAIVVAPPVT